VRVGRRGERASVLMLMPAGVLVVLLLGAIAFDLSLVFLRQRQASSLAVDVANDLATAALDEDAFRADGRFQLDADRAEELGRTLVESSDLGEGVVDVEVVVVGPDAVEVRVVVHVEYVFAKAIPGASDGTTVEAAATAVAVP
jgi:Flp pilus assembly protein TadG